MTLNDFQKNCIFLNTRHCGLQYIDIQCHEPIFMENDILNYILFKSIKMFTIYIKSK